MEAIIGGAAPGADPNLIKNGSTDSFMADVIDASHDVAVVVDFWAEWCGPCKQLGPALEKAVREAKGAVRMVKIDVDKNKELAAQMRIQSIPTVYAFRDGRPVDAFQGALPESQVKQFVAKLAATGGTGRLADRGCPRPRQRGARRRRPAAGREYLRADRRARSRQCRRHGRSRQDRHRQEGPETGR